MGPVDGRYAVSAGFRPLGRPHAVVRAWASRGAALPGGRFDTLTKQHLSRDFTRMIMLAEGKPNVSEDANRV
jgi:hypothetical protein